jgi:CheY-like chemotaxis protein
MERIHKSASTTTHIPPIVLLVEDHIDILDVCDATLSRRGHWVARAMNGLDALECAQDLQPHAIVTEVALPGDMDGTEVIRELHADQKLRDVPVLVMTSQDPPVAPDTLVGTIERTLKARSTSTENRPPPATAAIGRRAGSAAAARSKVDKKHRCCPHCGACLTWVETRRWKGVAYDYYRMCPNGCGLSCFNRYAEAFEHLITR